MPRLKGGAFLFVKSAASRAPGIAAVGSSDSRLVARPGIDRFAGGSKMPRVGVDSGVFVSLMQVTCAPIGTRVYLR